MFLGYQNGKIALAKDTREEIENAPCMTFDEIVETQDTYVLWGNEYILKSEADVREIAEAKAKQRAQYQDELKTIDLEEIRPLAAKAAGVATEEDDTKLAECEERKQAIRQQLQELGE